MKWAIDKAETHKVSHTIDVNPALKALFHANKADYRATLVLTLPQIVDGLEKHHFLLPLINFLI
jgi:hypothetical protein